MPSDGLAELVSVSPAIACIRKLIDRVAGLPATVLVTGPSGSGKEVVARLLHERGDRAAMPFVAINCGAIPAELIESELFGHEAGAFTGAAKARRGRFELAHGGTLFLDEIGEMPAASQVKLLRVLETRIVERVGGMIGTTVDVRVVAATNARLTAAIAAGQFREDLFYRLAVVEIALPALAARPEDIPLLIDHFARGTPVERRVRYTVGALAALKALPWRGNIGELRNFVERATALRPGELLDEVAVGQLTGSAGQGSDEWLAAPIVMPSALRLRTPPHPLTATATPVDLKQVLDEVEQGYNERALRATAGGVAESARLLGLRRTTLIEKMRRLNIVRMPA